MADTKAKPLKLIWKIENYSYCWNKNDDFIQSPTYPANALWNSTWFLRLYPRGVSSYQNYVSVRLGRLEDCEGPLGITVSYEIALLKTDGTPGYVKEDKYRYIRRGRAFGFDNLVPWEEILGAKKSTMLPEDTLTVQCLIFAKKKKLKTHTEFIGKTRIEVERSVFTLQTQLENHSFVHFSQCCPVYNSKGIRSLTLKLYAFPHEAPEKLEYSFWGCVFSVKTFHLKIGILDSNNTVSTYLINKHCYRNSKNTFDAEVSAISINQILKRRSLYLPDDKLTLHYDVSIAFETYHSAIELIVFDQALTYVSGIESSKLELALNEHSCPLTDKDSSLKNDLQNLYQEGIISDFTIKVGCENIQVHKAVLCARSPVFKAMLTSNMEENMKNILDISDLELDTVLNMLSYMYTDKIDTLDWEKARKLYFAADKYALLTLKRICSDFLKQSLHVTNFGAVITLANMHADEDLKEKALAFICDHQAEVIYSEEWKVFIAEELQLAAEIMHQMLLKKLES